MSCRCCGDWEELQELGSHLGHEDTSDVVARLLAFALRLSSSSTSEDQRRSVLWELVEWAYSIRWRAQ